MHLYQHLVNSRQANLKAVSRIRRLAIRHRGSREPDPRSDFYTREFLCPIVHSIVR